MALLYTVNTSVHITCEASPLASVIEFYVNESNAGYR